MGQVILLVDDEEIIANILKKYLEKEGYVILQAKNATEALTIFDNNKVDLIITDIMMPEKDGYEFIIDILETNDNFPFIFITAKNSNQDRLYSLALGAEDYITKPIDPRELVLRVKNIMRRIYGENRSYIKLNELEMDMKSRQAKIGDYKLNLTGKEFLLLWVLAQEPEKVFSKSEILILVWNSHLESNQNTVHVHVHNLREKLSQAHDANKVPTIVTVWGLGYKLEVKK